MPWAEWSDALRARPWWIATVVGLAVHVAALLLARDREHRDDRGGRPGPAPGQVARSAVVAGDALAHHDLTAGRADVQEDPTAPRVVSLRRPRADDTARDLVHRDGVRAALVAVDPSIPPLSDAPDGVTTRTADRPTSTGTPAAG